MDKPMSLQAREEMLESIKEKYQTGDWKTKHKLLDGFVAATGYERKHAIKLLNCKVTKATAATKRRGKRPYYDESVTQVLKQIWHASNQICSKRIIPFMPELLTALERHGHLSIDDATRNKLLSVSSATFDRLLKTERINVGRGISTTTPGTILKKSDQGTYFF